MSELTVRIKLPARPPRGGARRPRRQPGNRRPRQASTRNGDRAARLLALAHHIERLVEDGRLRDYAKAADALGLTRARVTQVMNLLTLAPLVQEEVLKKCRPIPARTVRGLTSIPDWRAQCLAIGGTRGPMSDADALPGPRSQDTHSPCTMGRSSACGRLEGGRLVCRGRKEITGMPKSFGVSRLEGYVHGR